MIRVVLPYHLRNLARIDGEVVLAVDGPATQRSVLDALEARYPMLRGTIRDHATQQRRPTNGKGPIHTLRHRNLKATIWRNETDKGPMFNVTLVRSCRAVHGPG